MKCENFQFDFQLEKTQSSCRKNFPGQESVCRFCVSRVHSRGMLSAGMGMRGQVHCELLSPCPVLLPAEALVCFQNEEHRAASSRCCSIPPALAFLRHPRVVGVGAGPGAGCGRSPGWTSCLLAPRCPVSSCQRSHLHSVPAESLTGRCLSDCRRSWALGALGAWASTPAFPRAHLGFPVSTSLVKQCPEGLCARCSTCSCCCLLPAPC